MSRLYFGKVYVNENWGLDMLSYSNYIASVDGGACVACGVCEDRCPMGAIAVEGDVACVDAPICLSCSQHPYDRQGG